MPHSNGRHWQRRPGSWDTLNMETKFPSDNAWGIPDLQHTLFDVPANLPLIPYTHRDDIGKVHHSGIAHFFLDDYRFESVWLRPLSLSLIHI